jgi:hypothetical protein
MSGTAPGHGAWRDYLQPRIYLQFTHSRAPVPFVLYSRVAGGARTARNLLEPLAFGAPGVLEYVCGGRAPPHAVGRVGYAPLGPGLPTWPGPVGLVPPGSSTSGAAVRAFPVYLYNNFASRRRLHQRERQAPAPMDDDTAPCCYLYIPPEALRHLDQLALVTLAMTTSTNSLNGCSTPTMDLLLGG